MPGRLRPFEIRLHGRGGQGIVTAAELLSVAAFLDGHWAQAFPSFGSERMGAPVAAFCRIGDAPVRTHEPIVAPDAVLITDATLLHSIDVFAGLRDDGFVVINSVRTPHELGLESVVGRLGTDRVRCVPASDIARHRTGRPIANVCLLGALAALTRVVTCGSLEDAVRRRFRPDVAEANIAALRDAFDLVGTATHA